MRLTRTHFELERVAQALANHQPVHTALLVVVRPGDLDATIITAERFASLRAAARVAAAANNNRAWARLTERIEPVPIAELPAVIHLAAKDARMRTCHAAVIPGDGRVAAAVFWFSRRERASAVDVAGRVDALRLLNAAR